MSSRNALARAATPPPTATPRHYTREAGRKTSLSSPLDPPLTRHSISSLARLARSSIDLSPSLLGRGPNKPFTSWIELVLPSLVVRRGSAQGNRAFVSWCERFGFRVGLRFEGRWGPEHSFLATPVAIAMSIATAVLGAVLRA
eukprot:2925162-Rhodomonas_salina.1